MNSYTQNRNIYPQSMVDAKRMINNYVPKFVPKNNSNKNKGKKQDDDYKPTEEEGPEGFPQSVFTQLDFRREMIP